MKHFVKRIARAVAGAFGQGTRVLQDFPLDRLAADSKLWVGLLRNAMQRSGRGFRTPSWRRQSFEAFASERRGPFSWVKLREEWQTQRRPDKVAAAERNARNPVFTGKINFRRSES